MVIARDLCALGLFGCGCLRATHILRPILGGTGELSVLTGTHPCRPPPRMMEVTRAPALVVDLWSGLLTVLNVSGFGKTGCESHTAPW